MRDCRTHCAAPGQKPIGDHIHRQRTGGDHPRFTNSRVGQATALAEEDKSFLSWERDLEREAQGWKDTSPEDAAKRDDGRLLRGLRLVEAERWLKQRKNDLIETERSFILASMSLNEKQQKEELEEALKARTRQRIFRGFALFAAFALFLSGISFLEWNQASMSAEKALASFLAFQSEQTSQISLSSIIVLNTTFLN
jgi:hypothetical protein